MLALLTACFLSVGTALSMVGQQSCQLTSQPLQAYSQEGDVVFGALVPVHSEVILPTLNFTERPPRMQCQRISFQWYQVALAIVFAIEEINRNPQILPNTTLGFQVLDSCYSDSLSSLCALGLLSGERGTVPNYSFQSPLKMAAIIGDYRSSSSIQVARILGLSRTPQISYGSGVPLLSNKHLFPSFVRTISSNERTPDLLAALVIVFGWTWVGILASSSDYGIHGGQKLRNQLEDKGVCVAFLIYLGDNNSQRKILSTVEIITNSKVTAMVVYGYPTEVNGVMDVLEAKGVANNVWLLSPAFLGSFLFLKSNLWPLLNGSVLVGPLYAGIPAFQKHLYNLHPLSSPEDIYITAFWEHVFKCRWAANNTVEKNIGDGENICTGAEQLAALPSSVYSVEFGYSYYAYIAVYVLAHALETMLSCNLRNRNCPNDHNFLPWQLLSHVRNVYFLDADGQAVFFDENGDSPETCDLKNWQISSNGVTASVNVGYYDARLPFHQRFFMNMSTIQWGKDYSQVPRSVCSESCSPGYRIAPRQGQPVCCFDCVLCPEGEHSTEKDAINCEKCPEGQWTNSMRNECIPKVVEFLSFYEPLGAGLAAIALIFSLFTGAVVVIFITYRDTPIVRANNRTLSYLLLCSLMLCFLCSLIFIGRPGKLTCLLRQTLFGVTFSFCVGCILAKTLLVVIAFKATVPDSSIRGWLGFKMPTVIILVCFLIQVIICTTWLTLTPPFLEINNQTTVGKIILQCNENSQTAFYSMLVFLGFLACISLLVAFRARTLPSSFNETKLITFSMVVFLSVWTSFIPAYLSTRGKLMVSVEIFAILASSAGLLICIFFPKCYIIILKPEMNKRTRL